MPSVLSATLPELRASAFSCPACVHGAAIRTRSCAINTAIGCGPVRISGMRRFRAQRETLLNIAGEVDLPFPVFVGAALVLAMFALVSLTGIKESSRIAAAVLACHVVTMAALGIAASVHWARSSIAQLRGNWKDGAMSSGAAVARQVFNRFCLGMLGLTG